MEQSMIQDLDSMRNSLGYKNTFTTSFRDGGYELKKSKISNLPSYKKSDLSPKLPFVLVFQTMEIERLSEQIESLRISLKDSERQAFNCQSYEIQIRELTDQCHEYDVQLLEYRQQIEKLNVISQKLYEELQEWKQKYQNYDPLIETKYNSKIQQCQNLENQLGKWKDRYRALQASKDREMEDLKLSMECQRKSVLDREIHELSLKFENERAYLTGQIKKMHQAHDERENELTQAKYEAESLRIEIEANMDAGKKLKESENKVNKLTQELVRLNQIIRRKQQEISRKEANQDYLKDMIKSLERQKFNHQNQAIKVPQLENAIKEWAIRFSRLESDNNENKEQLQRLPTLQKNLQTSILQNQKLGQMIRNKMQQIQEANTRANKYKAMYDESKKSQQKVPVLERRITEMGYEAERLNGILKKRLIEIEQGKNRIMTLEKQLKFVVQLESEKRKVEQQLRKQVKEGENLKKQLRQLQKQLRKIPQIEQVLNDQRKVREEYIREVDRLNKFVKDKSEETETCYEKINHLENKMSQFDNIQSELNAYKSQVNRMTQEIDAMNNKIRQKCSELEQIAIAVEQVQEHVQNYKKMEQKLIETIENTEKVTNQLNETKTQLQKSQQNLLICETQISEAKNTIMDINNDRQILNRNLQIKMQQLSQAETEINQYLGQIQQLKQIERCYHVLQEDMRQAEARICQLDDLLKRQRAINDQLDYKLQTAINEIERMKTNGYFPEAFRVKYQKLKVNAYEKQKELENLIRKQNMMEKCTDQIQAMIATIFSTMQNKNSEWLQTRNKIESSLKHINTISDLQNENSNLKTQNLELQSQIKILNLEILEAQVRKNANTQSINTTTPTSSVTSWSFNTVPSKKAIDSVVEEQTSSRISTISNNKRILGNAGSSININNGNALSRSKLNDGKTTSSRILLNSPSTNLQNTTSQLNQQMQASTASINSYRGVSPSVNSYFPSPTSKFSSTSKEATQTYFAMKTSKTSSVRQPYTLSSYRA